MPLAIRHHPLFSLLRTLAAFGAFPVVTVSGKQQYAMCASILEAAVITIPDSDAREDAVFREDPNHNFSPRIDLSWVILSEF